MNRTTLFTLPFYRMPDQSKGGMDRVQLDTVLEMNPWTRVTGDWKVA
jgi:hypothetical protein